MISYLKNSSGQVLMSLILGDNLNTGNIEFGLDGGLNLSSLTNTTASSSLNSFNLGFYFDIKMKEPWMLHTGVIVKSRLGASDLDVYSLGQTDLDNSFKGGSVNRKLDYFNTPVMLKYIFKNHFFLEAGINLGLLYNSKDEFINTINDDELIYNVKTKDNYHPLDAGFMGGIGYRLTKGYGMNLGIRYYLGFVDITVDDSGGNVKNSSIYFTAGIPIGVGKAREREKAKSEKMEK
jgi:hypothetical protein